MALLAWVVLAIGPRRLRVPSAGANSSRVRPDLAFLVSVALRIAALALLVLAAARPIGMMPENPAGGTGVDLLIALDASGSMLALDGQLEGRQVTRLELAKRAVAEFVRARGGDRIGLVAFARGAVMEQLETLPAQLQFRVICGATGSGKSRLLQQLDAAGAPVLDLEALACHRGSVLGGLPSQTQPGQKLFESLLWDRLRRFDVAKSVFVESESRKVGSLRVPDALLARMRDSPCIRLEVPLGVRVRLLRDEYAHFERDPGSLMKQLDCLVELHGHDRIQHWKALAEAGAWDRMVEELLRLHYGPAYARSIARNYRQSGTAHALPVDSDALPAFAAAARELLR